jgi:hypothetical protein
LALGLLVFPNFTQGALAAAADGPPPPATKKAVETEEGASRIQVLVGAEMNDAFWKEIFQSLPLVSKVVEENVRSQWNELEQKFGFHPMKHLHAVALLGFGPVNRKPNGVALVIQGQFDVPRLEKLLSDSQLVQVRGFLPVHENGKTLFRNKRGFTVRFVDSQTLLVLNGTQDEKFFALSGEGLPSPTDLEALRGHYGLSGTEFFFNLVVTPLQRRKMSKSPGPLAALGPQLETVGVRVEEKQVKVGATFLDEQITKQIEGMLGGMLAGVRGQVQGSLAGISLRPKGFEPGFGDLLNPKNALRKGALTVASDWVSGISLSRAGSSVILELDREKIPFLKLSSLGWLGTLVVPGMKAMQRYKALTGGKRLSGPFGGRHSPRKKRVVPGFRRSPGAPPSSVGKASPIPVPEKK